MYSVCTVNLQLICMPLAPIQQASFQVPVCYANQCFGFSVQVTFCLKFNVLSVKGHCVLFQMGRYNVLGLPSHKVSNQCQC